MKTRGMWLISVFCLHVIVLMPLRAQSSLLDQIDFVPVAGPLVRPIAVTNAGDGTGRLFITQEKGKIAISDGEKVTATFLDIQERVGCCRGESGFYDVAFHPDYENNGYFYVSYTETSEEVGDLIISRFRVTNDPNLADTTSEKIVLRVGQLTSLHQAGHLEFGPDGFLYVSLGDGGGSRDPNNVGQRLDTLLGSIVRIDVDGGDPYAIPPTNPFVGVPNARGEIWAYGLRNPWRFGFDRLTGDLFIGDVGAGGPEEISFQPSSSGGGENYGWRIMEGNTCRFRDEGCGDESLTPPILEYLQVKDPDLHDGVRDCGGAVIGGYPYRGSAFPQLAGVYFGSSGFLVGGQRVAGSSILPTRRRPQSHRSPKGGQEIPKYPTRQSGRGQLVKGIRH